MSIADDVRTYITTMTDLRVVTEQETMTRQIIQGVQVRQRAVSTLPDALLECDTSYVDVIVMGIGEKGLAHAWEVAEAIYRRMLLVLDVKVGETHFIKIQADSNPFEVGSTASTEDRWVQFGLQVVRYIGE
jgi:hypothetical protein